MRGLYISFTSSCFLFPVGGGSKKFDDWGLKNFRAGGGNRFEWESVPHYMPCDTT